MARLKLTFVTLCAISYCLCDLDLQKKDKLVRGFVEFYNLLPNEAFTCDEGFLLNAQQTDISNAYDIEVSLKVSETHNLDTTKYLKCTATIADLSVGVAVMKHHCQDDANPAANPANIEEEVDPDAVTEPYVTEPEFVRKPIQLDNEVQTNTAAVTSGEQFIAIPREEPKVHCIGCSSHVNPEAQGVRELADLGVRQLNSLEPNVHHTLTSVVDVERQVQVVNGVRYILTLLVDYNSCRNEQTEPCVTSKACKVTVLEKPWMQLPSGSKYRAILSNNCTQEWRFGDDGVVPPSDNKENNNINPSDSDSGTDIKVINNVDVQSQPKTEKSLTDQDIKDIEEQIIPHNQAVRPNTNQHAAESLDSSKEHAVKVEPDTQYSPNSIQTGKPQKVETLDEDKKKTIDELLNYFELSGFDSKKNSEQTASRLKRSYENDLNAINMAERFQKLKKSIENAKKIYVLAQSVVDYLNDIDLEVKNRVLKDVTNAEKESEKDRSFYYIQFHTVVPCKSRNCKKKDTTTKLCNAVVDSSEKVPQVMTAFCHDEEINNHVGKVRNVPNDDPLLQKLIFESISKIESESKTSKAMKLNKVINANTQKVTGTVTKISMLLDQTDCEKSVPFLLRKNCSVVEEYGSQICDVIIHERHWLKERSISFACTERPIDVRFSLGHKDAVLKNANDPAILDMVQEAMRNLETQSKRNNKPIVIKINSVSTQLVAGFLTNIEFVIGFTSCASDVNVDEVVNCKLLESEPLKTCKAKVWDRSWMEDGRQVEVSCNEPIAEADIADKTLTMHSQPTTESVLRPSFNTLTRTTRDVHKMVGGQEEKNRNDPKYKQLAEESLQKYLQDNGNSRPHKVVSVEHVTKQVVAGSLTRIIFKISPTDQTSGDTVICDSKIWEKPWENFKEIKVSCEIDDKKVRNKRLVLGPGAPSEVNPNDPEYKQLAEESLQKYLQENGNSKPHKVVSVEHVTKQVVAGSLTRIIFKISPTDQTSGDTVICDSKIWEKPWENFKEIKVSCEIDDKKVRNKRLVLGPGAPSEVNPNDPEYKQLAEESLQKYLQDNGNSKPHKVVSVEHVTKQVVAGSLTRIFFKISPTDQTSGDTVICNSKIWEKPWENFKEIKVSCEIDDKKVRNKRLVLGPGAPSEVNPNDPEYKQLAEESLQKYLENNGNSKPLKVVSVEHVTEQVVAGILTKIKFKVSPIDQTSGDTITCNSEIWKKLWENFKQIKVSCEIVSSTIRDKRNVIVTGASADVDSNDPNYKKLAEESLQKYLQDTGISQPHRVVSVKHVTKQIVAGTLIRITFTIAPEISTSRDVITCKSEVWEKVWMSFKQITVTCDIDEVYNSERRNTNKENSEPNYAEPSRTKRNVITGGMVEQNPKKLQYKKLAEISLRKYLQESDISEPHRVVNVEKAFTQVVSGVRTVIIFKMAPISSSSADIISCVSDIWEQSWQHTMNITVRCELDAKRIKRHIGPIGGPHVEDPTKEEYRTLARDALNKYKKKHKNVNNHVLTEVKSVIVKVTRGITYIIEFSAAHRSCAYDLSTCPNNNPVIYCRALIQEQPWLLVYEIDVACKNKNVKRNKRAANLIEAEHDNKWEQLTELEIVDVDERGKRQAGIEDDYVDEDKKFYYADRAIQQLNDQLRSNNMYKLITIHSVQSSVHMENTPMVRLYLEAAETYCLRNRHDEVRLSECEELDANNHRLCLARIWPSPDDEMVIQSVAIVCDDDEKFESITGLSLALLLKASIRAIEDSSEMRYKLVHQGEPQLIPSLDYSLPNKINFIVRVTNCSKDVDNIYKQNCFVDTTKPSKACSSFIWLVPNSRSIDRIRAGCHQTEFRSRRSIPLSAENATIDDIEIQNMVKESLQKLEMTTSDRYKQKVIKINRYTTKVTTGKITTIDFVVAFTTCLKFEWVDDLSTCKLLEHLPRRHCVAEVWERLWLESGRKIDVSCLDEAVPLEAHVEFQSAATATALAQRALKHIEAKYPHPRKAKVLRIYSMDKQVVAGVHYRMKMEVGLTNCSALSADSQYCVFDEHAGGTNKFCRVNVWLRPWTDHPPSVRVSCDYQEGAVADVFHQLQAEFLFRDFLATYSPDYVDDYDEMMRRFQIFKDNVRKMHELNTRERGTATYGVTRFADLTYEEFTKKHLGLKPSLRNENQVPMRKAQVPEVEAPEAFDWRERGAVTEVKNQGSCGSCWAFSVTGNIEGQYQIKTGKLVSLSEQELVDCDKMDDGCNGGLPDNAYRAIEQLGGLELETDYPYEGDDEKCAFNKTMAKVQISSAVNITSNETDMAKWLVKNGPISIGINANAMQFYMGGVSHPWKMLCNPKNLDHGVLIVGYGIKDYPLFHKRLPYWIVKNSWGPSWGEQGYYRVYRGDGTCGVNQMASSAVI